MEINSLPEELLCQILIKLPTKSILITTSVCKTWYILITTSHFISLHLNHTHFRNKPTILLRRYLLPTCNETYTFYNIDSHIYVIESLYFPFKSTSVCFVILGCVNGLLCLWDYKSCVVILWNPCIRKYYTLPKYVMSGSCRVFGFGYDAFSDDYKVVARGECGCLFSVFSLKEKCWRDVGFVPNWNTVCLPRTVGGIIHRVTSLEDHGMKVVSFDLSSELCSEFACPSEVVYVDPSQVELAIFRDSLALVYGLNERKTDVWVFREGCGGVKSWSKLFSINREMSMLQQFIGGFGKSGVVVMVGRAGAVVEAIVESPVIANLGLSGPEYYWQVESYEESLVLLLEGDDVTLVKRDDGDGKKVDVDEAPVTIIID